MKTEGTLSNADYLTSKGKFDLKITLEGNEKCIQLFLDYIKKTGDFFIE